MGSARSEIVINPISMLVTIISNKFLGFVIKFVSMSFYESFFYKIEIRFLSKSKIMRLQKVDIWIVTPYVWLKYPLDVFANSSLVSSFKIDFVIVWSI